MSHEEDVNEAKLLAETRLANARATQIEHETAHHAAMNASRVYHFCAPIIEQTVDTCIDVLNQWLHYSADPVTLAFNSGGGQVFAGFALFDFVREQVAAGHHIETSVYGFAASMAAVITQAGTVRTMRPNAWIMAHEATTGGSGTTSAMKDQVDLAGRLQEQTMKIMVSRTGRKTSLTKLKRNTNRKDWWLNAEEALEAGFIDAIVP